MRYKPRYGFYLTTQDIDRMREEAFPQTNTRKYRTSVNFLSTTKIDELRALHFPNEDKLNKGGLVKILSLLPFRK